MTSNPFVKTKPLVGKNITENTEEAKKWLDKISPTMCLAKWFHVSLHLTNGRTHSCYHPPTHRIDLAQLAINPKALHNTDTKKHERKQMLGGERPEGCSYCWKTEDALPAPHGGHRSDRHYRSGEYWAVPYKQLALDLGSEKDVNPTYVEVNFNQACNFKCSYCSPHLSSEWQKEVEKFGSYPTTVPHNNIASLEKSELMPLKGLREDNPYIEAFWKWWPDLYKNLHMFRMTGGEPLMDTNTFKVLEYVANNPKGDLEISITSNMCPPDSKLLDRFIQALQKIEIYRAQVKVICDSENHVLAVIDKESVPSDSLRRFGLEDIPTSSMDEGHAFIAKNKVAQPDKTFQFFSYVDTKACKHFSLFVSLDSWGEQAEYIRNGMNFKNLLFNVRRVLYETHFSTITFINTFNLFSVSGLQTFLQGILELRQYVNSLKDVEGKTTPEYNFWNRQRIWFDIPVLSFPAWQRIQNLPENFQTYIQEAIVYMQENHVSIKGDLIGFNDFEIDKVKRNLSLMRIDAGLNPTELSRRKKDFYLFFSEHDRRRNVNLVQTFPELKNYWISCQQEFENESKN